MVTSILKHELVVTTDARAKELKRVTDKMVTLGKRGDLHARRRALSYVRDRQTVEKLFSELAVRYQTREGGYTRIIKTGNRVGDNAPVSIVELVDRPRVQKQEKKEIKKKEENP